MEVLGFEKLDCIGKNVVLSELLRQIIFCLPLVPLLVAYNGAVLLPSPRPRPSCMCRLMGTNQFLCPYSHDPSYLFTRVPASPIVCHHCPTPVPWIGVPLSPTLPAGPPSTPAPPNPGGKSLPSSPPYAVSPSISARRMMFQPREQETPRMMPIFCVWV